MADDPTKTDPATGDPSADTNAGATKPDDLPEGAKKALADSRAAENAAEKRAKAAEKSAKEAREAFEAAQNAGKSDLDKLTERVTAAEERAAKAEHESLVNSVLAAKKLPPSSARFLHGDTQEEIEQSADDLIALIQPDGKPATAGSFSGGQRGGGSGKTTSVDIDAEIRRMAGRG